MREGDMPPPVRSMEASAKFISKEGLMVRSLTLYLFMQNCSRYINK